MSQAKITFDRSLIPRDELTLTPGVRTSVAQFFEPIQEHIKSIVFSPAVHTAALLREDAPVGSNVRGYVLQIDGTAPAKTLFDSNFSRSTVVMPVVGATGSSEADDEFYSVDKKAIVSQFEASSLSKSHPGVNVGLFSTRDGLDEKYVVVAEGTDEAAVGAFLQDAQNSSVQEMYASPLHKAALAKNREHVISAARAWATDNGLRLAAEPTLETRSFTLKHDEEASVDPEGAGDTGSKVFLYYNDVTNVANARGGALVSKGLLGGFVEVRANNDIADDHGRRSYAWNNDKHNMLPTHTGAYINGCDRRAALHYNDNERTKKSAEAMIKWDGDFSDYNHSKEMRYNDFDKNANVWLAALSGDADITTRQYETVVVQPAAVSQEGLSLKDLMLVSRGSPVVNIPLSNPVVGKIVVNWATLHPHLVEYKADDLGRVLSKQSKDGKMVTIDRDVLEQVARD